MMGSAPGLTRRCSGLAVACLKGMGSLPPLLRTAHTGGSIVRMARRSARLFLSAPVALPLRAQRHFLDQETALVFCVIDTDQQFVVPETEIDGFGEGYELIEFPDDYIDNLVCNQRVLRAGFASRQLPGAGKRRHKAAAEAEAPFPLPSNDCAVLLDSHPARPQSRA